MSSSATIAATETLDNADLYFRSDKLRSVEFTYLQLKSLEVSTALAIVNTGNSQGEAAAKYEFVTEVYKVIYQLPVNLKPFLSSNALYNGVQWPAVAKNVSSFLMEKDVPSYLDSDLKLTRSISHLVGQAIATASGKSASDAKVTAAASALVQALLPTIHQARVRALHSIRVAVHFADLADVPATSISKLNAVYGISDYTWLSYLLSDGLSTGFKLAST